MSVNDIPVEIWEMISSHLGPFNDGGLPPTRTPSLHQPNPKENVVCAARQALANLRLTCQFFHAFATPLLFQTIVTAFPDLEDELSWVKWLNRVESLRETPLTKHARKLTVKLTAHRADGEQDYYPKRDHEEMATISQHGLKLLDLAESMHGLTHLSLELSLVAQYDEVLKKLCVLLSKHSGPAGIKSLTLIAGPVIKDTYWSRCPLPSPSNTLHLRRFIRNLQHARVYVHPTFHGQCGKHLNAAWELLRYARSLTSIHLDYPMMSVISNLKTFGAEGPEDLRELRLNAAGAPAQTLIALIDRYSHSLTRVSFRCVYLRAGTWSSVILRLCKCPRLLDFAILECGYRAADGRYIWDIANSDDTEQRRSAECLDVNFLSIRSSDPDDFLAQGHIQRHVNRARVRKGFLPYDSDAYRYTEKPPVLGHDE